MKSNYLVQAWLVLALAVGFGAALAGVQVGLNPRIEINKQNETYDQIPALVLGVERKDETVDVRELATDDGRIAYEVSSGGAQVGWVIKAVGQGFADKIELLIGLDTSAGRILGMYVLDQKETPALGNRITEPQWRAQFPGLDAGKSVEVVKTAPAAGDNAVQAVTGATVSSLSVCNIVNQSVEQFRRDMGDLKEKE
jgi:H+/Na+-translocating ferredoxin:NAD+ oxidoreductase subunit G